MVLPHRGNDVSMKDLKVMGDLGQVNLQFFDVRDYESVLRCVENSDVVVNLISRDYKTFNFTIDDANHVAARAIARAAKESNVARFIYTSCLPASEKSRVEYFKAKVSVSFIDDDEDVYFLLLHD